MSSLKSNMRTVRISDEVFLFLQSKVRNRTKLSRGESVNKLLMRLLKIGAHNDGKTNTRAIKRTG